MAYRKSDVQFHCTGYYGPALPAANVKVYGSMPQFPLPECEGMTEEWFDAYAEENAWLFEAACEDGREQIESFAKEIFGNGVQVWFEGRSGGWAVVDGLSEFDSWDAIMLGKWHKFEKHARAEAAGVPYQMVMIAYLNGFLAESQEA